MTKALIFDFDGLILDTEGPDFCSWQEIWEQHGVTLSLDAWAACIGTSGNFDAYDLLERTLGTAIDRQAVRDMRHPRYTELLLQEAVSPGVIQYLDAAKEFGLSTAVASSSSRAWVEGQLVRLNLLDRFDAICCRDDAGRPKPDPAVYQLALDKLGVHPGEAIAFEDSPNGIAAAKAAGIYCVAVPCGLTATLDLSEADLHLGSLEESTLTDLLSRVVNASRTTEKATEIIQVAKDR